MSNRHPQGQTRNHERRRPAWPQGLGEQRRLARAGGAFGPRRPSSAPGNVSIVCEVIEGAGPNRMPGDPEPGGKAERPGTAQRLDGDPQGPDPGNAGEGRPPRRQFLFCPARRPSRCRGNGPLSEVRLQEVPLSRSTSCSHIVAERFRRICACRKPVHLGMCTAARRRLSPASGAGRAGVGLAGGAMIFGLWA